MRARGVAWKIVAGGAGTLLLILIGLPIVSLIVRVPPRALVARMNDPIVLDALRLSLITSFGSTALVVLLGLPVAYALASRDFRGRRVLEAIVSLPILIPPTVAGVGLLLAFGRAGIAGGALNVVGITLPFTTLGVVVAQTFVATPFFVLTAAAGFREVEQRYLDAAASLRASPAYTFLRVVLPLALPSLAAGAAMSWARSLGEFGATITFAGNLPGVTQTMPLAVYLAFQTDLEAAVALSVLLVFVSLLLLLVLGRTPFAPASKGPGARARP